MSRFLQWNVNAYRATLWLYPDDLRREFGPEMVEFFSCDLAAEYTSHGALRIWRIALLEAVRVGLAGRLRSSSVFVAVSAAAIHAGSLTFALLEAIRRTSTQIPHWGGSVAAEVTLCILLPAAVTGLMALIAIRRQKNEEILSLDLH